MIKKNEMHFSRKCEAHAVVILLPPCKMLVSESMWLAMLHVNDDRRLGQRAGKKNSAYRLLHNSESPFTLRTF